MKNAKVIGRLEFQVLSPGEGPGNILEFLDSEEDAVMQVEIDEEGTRKLVIFQTDVDIVMDLDEMKRGIEVAERNVMKFDWEKTMLELEQDPDES